MNKKFLKVAFVAVIVLVSGFNVFNSHKTKTLSDVVLDNVEALAAPEYVIACVSPYANIILFYCKYNPMLFCYCDGLNPGQGWEKTDNSEL